MSFLMFTKAISPQMKTLLIRIAAFLTIMLVGALLFMTIEGGGDNSTAIPSLDEIRRDVMAAYNVSERDFKLLVEAVRNDTHLPKTGISWTFGNSVYFCVVLITTIGYGHIAPRTWQGQLFCIFYSLFGIPITALMLKSVGEYITLAIHTVLFRFEKRMLKREPVNIETKCFVISLLFMMFILVTGAVVTTYSEQWTMMEGIYFIFVTLTTIGFGDYIINSGRLMGDSTAETTVNCLSLILLIVGLGIVSSVLCSISKLIETGGCLCFGRRKRERKEDNREQAIDKEQETMELSLSNAENINA